MLRIIISPAKKMVSSRGTFEPSDEPVFSDQATRLLGALETLDAQELQQLWRVSDKLLTSCLSDLQALGADGIPRCREDLLRTPFATTSSAALFTYSGLQYRSLAPTVLDEGALYYLQEHLRILSGFYGCVRPFDAVLPYRLEMGAPTTPLLGCDLYDFWGNSLAKEVCVGSSEEEPCQLINAASVEYALAVTPHLGAHTQLTTCVFGEEIRAGKPVVRASAAKIARGSLVRWMAEHAVCEAAELRAFDVGYTLMPELSSAPGDPYPHTLVFCRAA